MNIEKHIQNMLQVKRSKITPSSGKILIAEPFMHDMYFRRTVILLIDHSDEGSFGVVLNKPTFIKIKEVVDDFADVDYPLFSGGPVSIDNLFFLHRLSDIIPDSIPVDKDIFWGGNRSDVGKVLETNYFDETQLRVFMGYSSWEAGQLEEELKQNSWVVADFNSDVLFNSDPAKLWYEVVDRLGNDYKIWKNLPVNPSLN